MPAILIRVLLWFSSSFLARILVGAGLSFISISFINGVVSDAQMAIGSYLGGLPSDVLGLISTIKIPQAIGVVMSAVGIVSSIKSAKMALGKAS